jgi:hypothetical protein
VDVVVVDIVVVDAFGLDVVVADIVVVDAFGLDVVVVVVVVGIFLLTLPQIFLAIDGAFLAIWRNWFKTNECKRFGLDAMARIDALAYRGVWAAIVNSSIPLRLQRFACVIVFRTLLGIPSVIKIPIFGTPGLS